MKEKMGKGEQEELEKRVIEEQRKLSRKQAKQQEKAKKNPEAQKSAKQKDKELSDRLKTRKHKKDDFAKQADYHRFIEHEKAKLDYSSLFSYFGSGVRQQEYSYASATDAVSIIQRKDETISWEKINAYVEESKMNQLLGINRDFVTNDDREAYKWWKALNVWQAYRLFETSLT